MHRENEGPNDDTRIGGVLLAAGRSQRFGEENKLLTTLEGVPLVVHATRTLLASDLDDVVIVVGHEAGRVRAALDDCDVDVGGDVAVRYNADYVDGQSASVRVGAETADELGWDAAVFALGDMPWVDPRTVDQLTAAYRTKGGTEAETKTESESILAPSIDGRRGNPVLFDATHFDALASVSGDRGGRRVLEAHDGTTLVPVDDPGIRRDVDEPADL